MAAGIAAHAIALKLFVQVSFTNIVIENFTKRSHWHDLYSLFYLEIQAGN